MRPSLCFVVPAHGRQELAAICLRQLRRTCDALDANGIRATAVVVADDDNLTTASELGFDTYRRDNQFLSRRFNDGIQSACDPKFSSHPADYVVPCGSDDWIDWRILTDLPSPNTVVGFQRMSFVREDGREISAAHIAYSGGCGMRIYPRKVLAALDYRPADEDRTRACDTSILTNLKKSLGDALLIAHRATDHRAIVDWKNPAEQINSYQGVRQWCKPIDGDPFAVLADVYPAEALDEMAAYYARDRTAVAA